MKLGILIPKLRAAEGESFATTPASDLWNGCTNGERPCSARHGFARDLTEIKQGRGIKGSDGTYYVNLDLTHLGAQVIHDENSEITGFARRDLGVELLKEPIPIQPNAHYTMGEMPDRQ